MNYKENSINECIGGLFDNETHLSDRDAKRLPSNSIVSALLDDIKKVLYPNFYADAAACFCKTECKAALESIFERLKNQIKLSYDFSLGKNKDNEEKADKVTAEFIAELPSVFHALKLDVEATFEGDPASESIDLILLTYPGIEAIGTYRLAHLLFKKGVPLIPRMMTELAHSKTGIDIHPGAKIGKSFVIDHGTGIVIGETTEIGDYVKIYQGVTLGAISLKNAASLVGKKRHPTIKDNVTIYSGATILGGKTVIEEGAVIGSSVFITKSVEKGVTVAMEKPKLRLYTNDPINPKI